MKIIFTKKDFLSMRWLIIFSIIIFSVISLSSCVTTQKDFTYLNDQIVALNNRVTKLQESIDTKLSHDLDSRLEPIHSRQANVGTEIDNLRAEIAALSGRVEESEHLIKRVVERDLSEQDAMQAGLVQLTQTVTELETLVKRQQEYLGLEAGAVKKEHEKVAMEPKEAALKPPSIVEEPKSKEVELYDMSLVSFREGRYEEAMEGFKRFLRTYPKSDRADNAQFWIGECFMAMEQFEQAILAYQEVIKKYPTGNKVPNAMLRQATAFLSLNDKISTKLLLKKIVQKYPESNEAKIARKKLETLK